jgi:hypothetical protein
MGQVFGYSGVEEPAYTLVWQSTQRPSCEVRLYKSYFVAQVACKDNTLNDAFYQLANYIGVFGAPQNIQSKF